MKHPRAFIRGLMAGEDGATLMETLVALVLVGVIAVAFLSALTTAARSSYDVDERAMAESLARSQMEYVKSTVYVSGATQYPVSPNLTAPLGWTIPSTTAEPLASPDAGIQRVTVMVQRHGDTVLTVQSYKVNR